MVITIKKLARNRAARIVVASLVILVIGAIGVKYFMFSSALTSNLPAIPDTNYPIPANATYMATTGNDANTGTRGASIFVPARRSFARFVGEILTVPVNSVGVLTIRSRDSSVFSAIGLRYTGAAFTTIPAN